MRTAVIKSSAPANSWTRLEQGLALLVFAWLGLRTFHVVQVAWPFTTDDGYITLRYARHLVEGHGIVWNVGESPPVEGYSNFLFLMLGAGALKLGIDPMLLLKGLCCAAIVPTWALMYILARRWVSPLVATLPAVLLSAHPGTIYWAVSGLETNVYQLLVVAATTAFVVGLRAREAPDAEGRWGWSRFRLHLVAAALCCLAALTRPEAPLLVVVLGVTALADTAVRWIVAHRARDQAGKSAARRALLVSIRAVTLAFVIPYAVYFVWRFAHFGRLAPNTVYCKSVFNDKGGDPWYLIREFWDQSKVFIFLALVQDPRKLGARALPLFLLPLGYVAILFHADPIVGQFSRHFLPALALLVVASSVGLSNLAALGGLPFRLLGRALSRGKGEQSRAWFIPFEAAVVLACLVLFARGQSWLEQEVLGSPDLGAHDRSDKKDPWILAPPYDLAWHATCYSRKTKARTDLGRYLDRALSPDQTYVLGDTGLAPYLSHASVIDSFCLNSREMTTPPVSFDRARFTDWMFSRSPDVLVVHTTSPQRLEPVSDEIGFYPALVADPRFRRLYQQPRPAPIFFGEGAGYWVFEKKKACALSLTTGNAACDACMTASCCSENNACAATAPCATCMSAESPSASCGSRADLKGLESCVESHCSSQCAPQ